MFEPLMELEQPSNHEAARWRRDALTLVEGVPPIFLLKTLQERHWACVAVEDELEHGPATMLAQACATYGFISGWSLEIPWTPSNKTPSAYRMKISANSLHALSKEVYLGSCFLIVEKAGNFALSSDGDLYWMLAGPRAFLESALGISVEEQLKKFVCNVASYSNADPRVFRVLTSVNGVAVSACAAA